jgi:hypothetical protein
MFDQQMQNWFNNAWANGTIMRPQDAVLALLQGPEDFLRKHPIVNMFDCRQNGVTQAYFKNDRQDALRPGSRLGTLNMHTTESFLLENTTGHNFYGYQFPVHGVYTGPGDQPPVWYRLDGSGPAVMLTAKLTGCTFVAKPAGGWVDVTHLQPTQNIDGLQLNRDMNTGSKSAYGRLRYDYDVRSINVVGVRVGNAWQIWAQKLDKNANPIRLLSLTKIWPL